MEPCHRLGEVAGRSSWATYLLSLCLNNNDKPRCLSATKLAGKSVLFQHWGGGNNELHTIIKEAKPERAQQLTNPASYRTNIIHYHYIPYIYHYYDELATINFWYTVISRCPKMGLFEKGLNKSFLKFHQSIFYSRNECNMWYPKAELEHLRYFDTTNHQPESTRRPLSKVWSLWNWYYCCLLLWPPLAMQLTVAKQNKGGCFSALVETIAWKEVAFKRD